MRWSPKPARIARERPELPRGRDRPASESPWRTPSDEQVMNESRRKLSDEIDVSARLLDGRRLSRFEGVISGNHPHPSRTSCSRDESIEHRRRTGWIAISQQPYRGSALLGQIRIGDVGGRRDGSLSGAHRRQQDGPSASCEIENGRHVLDFRDPIFGLTAVYRILHGVGPIEPKHGNSIGHERSGNSLEDGGTHRIVRS